VTRGFGFGGGNGVVVDDLYKEEGRF